MLYKDFYKFYQSPQGLAASQSLQKHIKGLWNFSGDAIDANNRILLHVGYGEGEENFLSSFFERSLLVTPHEIDEGGSKICVAEMEHLPFGDMSVDNILCVHGLEFAEDIDSVVSEFWRILVVGGRLLLVVPLFGFGKSPFGWGRSVGYFAVRGGLQKSGFEILKSRLSLLGGGIMLLDCRKVFIDDGWKKTRVAGNRYFVPRLRPI